VTCGNKTVTPCFRAPSSRARDRTSGGPAGNSTPTPLRWEQDARWLLEEALGSGARRVTLAVPLKIPMRGRTAGHPDGYGAGNGAGPSIRNARMTVQGQVQPTIFVIGAGVTPYHAAAMAVATPGAVYNPLVHLRGVGLGKTHLPYAVGQYVENRPTSGIRYVTSARTSPTINLVRDNAP